MWLAFTKEAWSNDNKQFKLVITNLVRVLANKNLTRTLLSFRLVREALHYLTTRLQEDTVRCRLERFEGPFPKEFFMFETYQQFTRYSGFIGLFDNREPDLAPFGPKNYDFDVLMRDRRQTAIISMNWHAVCYLDLCFIAPVKDAKLLARFLNHEEFRFYEKIAHLSNGV